VKKCREVTEKIEKEVEQKVCRATTKKASIHSFVGSLLSPHKPCTQNN